MRTAWLKCDVWEAQMRGLGERAQASQGAARHGGGGGTKGSIWRFAKGRDDEPVGDWQDLGNNHFIDNSMCGLVRGCALRRLVIHFHEQPSSMNFRVV